jgi:Pregnancy-associated plasma protein-A/Secretion system C-terminal sorting domain
MNNLWTKLPVFTLIIFVIATTITNAQNQCAAVEVAAQNLLVHPELIAKRQATLAAIQSQLETNAQSNFVQDRSVVTIPVVVHVVYNGNSENITDAQIMSQIDVFNIDFRKLNANAANIPTEFAPLAADTELEFCLASKDENGMNTTGITRRSTSISNISMSYAPDGRTKVCHTSLGGSDAWDETKYLNIWVAKIGSGILGFGTFPGTSILGEDGIFIDARYFGKTGLAIQNPPNHLGRTAVHEIGHYFDLRHIWGEEDNSCEDDDGVEDTPKQRNSYSGCPVHPQLSCGNKAMFMNYMDYTVDGCMSMFTLGQKNRLRATLESVRAGLISSNGCGTSGTKQNEKFLSDIKISPNPASETIQISIPFNEEKSLKYWIFDNLGKVVLGGVLEHQSVKTLDVSSLYSGFYVLKVETDKGVFLEKIQIIH